MRLLHTKNHKIENFVPSKAPKEYAILSHTWEEEEVTLENMENGNAQSLKGYQKLMKSCNRALNDGYEWIWIDTCCIDKRNSAELSEAINSMFEYYSRSAVCYAYLSNVSYAKHLETATWFDRGWTLQELLAPRKVIFFASNWQKLGTKRDYSRRISSRTRIPEDVLLGKSFYSCNAGQRMSWASERQTTREEDMAYCMLGLFDIQMVPMYGEGEEQAFLRLQEAIMQRSADHTLFIWTPEHDPNNQGLLASSPKAFCNHSSCFTWMGLRQHAAQNPFDPYAHLKRLPNTISKRLSHVDAMTGRSKLISVEDSEYLATASLGQSGLQISLLSHIQNEGQFSRALGTTNKLLCFDLFIDNTDSEDPVLLVVTRDIDVKGFHGLVPNRLGAWRRHDWTEGLAEYNTDSADLSFDRRTIAFSQIKAPMHYSGPPVTFEFDGKHSKALISQLFLVQPEGNLKMYPIPPQSFKCQGGIAGFQHSCTKCGPLSTVVLGFGGHGRRFYQPWCFIGTTSVSEKTEFSMEDLHAVYEKERRSSARFNSESTWTLPCKMTLKARIELGNEDCYLIKLSVESRKTYKSIV